MNERRDARMRGKVREKVRGRVNLGEGGITEGK